MTASTGKPQPRAGETVMHCGHPTQNESRHWFQATDYIAFRRPDGTTGKAQWITICEECLHRRLLPTDPTKPVALEDFIKVIRGDGVWEGGNLIYKDKGLLS